MPAESESSMGRPLVIGPIRLDAFVFQETLAHRVVTLSIVDQLTVPDVTPGDYVLQFRYDAEQTPQVWNSCADVRINPQSISV